MTTVEETDTLFFYGHHKEKQWSFLSNFYEQPYPAPDPRQWLGGNHQILPVYEDLTRCLNFSCSEQYMMYCKAVLFSDDESAQQVLEATSPSHCKALGRKVQNFDDRIWVRYREQIMEEALWWKFGGDTPEVSQEISKIGKKLLQTGERELVEAAARDRIWGIGFAAGDAEQNRPRWGLNLLGQALMKVRNRLRARYVSGEVS